MPSASASCALRVHALPPAVVSSGDWVAVHVRWGDKIVSESVKRPIERYLGLARAVDHLAFLRRRRLHLMSAADGGVPAEAPIVL